MKHVVSVIATLALVACGGGGSTSTGPEVPDTKVQGFYKGMTDSSSYWNVFIRSNGEYYILTQAPDSGGDDFSNAIFGTVTAENGDITSTDTILRSFSGGGTLSRNLSASYVAGENITGILERPEDGTGSGFTVYFDSNYQYPPDLKNISGAFQGKYKGFSGDSGESEPALITIDINGKLVGSRPRISGCGFEGTIQPGTTDNFFDVSISFLRPDCLLGDIILDGVAYYDPVYKQLLISALTSDKSAGLFFSGINKFSEP